MKITWTQYRCCDRCEMKAKQRQLLECERAAAKRHDVDFSGVNNFLCCCVRTARLTFTRHRNDRFRAGIYSYTQSFSLSPLVQTTQTTRQKNDNNRNWKFNFFLHLFFPLGGSVCTLQQPQMSTDFWTLFSSSLPFVCFIPPEHTARTREKNRNAEHNMRYDYWLYNSFLSPSSHNHQASLTAPHSLHIYRNLIDVDSISRKKKLKICKFL